MFHSQSQSTEFRVWKWGVIISLPFFSVFSKVILCWPISTCVPDLSAAAGLPVCASNLLSTSLQHGATYPHCKVHLVGTFPLHVLLHLTTYIVVPLSGSVVAAVHFSDFNLTQHVPRHGCLPAGKQANLSNAVTATRVRYTTCHAGLTLHCTLTLLHTYNMQMQAFLYSLCYKMMRCRCNTIYNKDV